MVPHHCPTDGVAAPFGAEVRDTRKSETMDLCAAVNLPYQRMDTGMSPLSTPPWWYVSRSLSGGTYSSISLLLPTESCAMLNTSATARAIAGAIAEMKRWCVSCESKHFVIELVLCSCL